MGLICCPVGILVGLYVSNNALSEGWQYFFIYSGLAAFIVPFLIWWLFVERSRKRSRTRSVFAGIAGAALSHVVCWLMIFFSMRISYLIFGVPVSSLKESPADLFYGLMGALFFTGFSLIYLGWITLPVGGVIGYVYETFLSRDATPVDKTS